jgi:GntR family transcriptional regulator/MocR family aminotransferase
MRAEYGARREALVDALRRNAPHITLTGLAAGFHAVAHPRDGAVEGELIRAARARSVALYGMSPQRFDGAIMPPALVLGFGNVGERAISAGIEAIKDLL